MDILNPPNHEGVKLTKIMLSYTYGMYGMWRVYFQNMYPSLCLLDTTLGSPHTPFLSIILSSVHQSHSPPTPHVTIPIDQRGQPPPWDLSVRQYSDARQVYPQ